MTEPHDPNRTADIPSAPPDSLDAGLAAGFGRRADGPASVLSQLPDSLGDLRPVLLREAEGESAHVVKPNSDAMPDRSATGDRYQLQGEIARGGMGAVLRGRDVDLGRDLAVKVLLEKYADRPEVARRFIEEAQIGGQLQHPGVVPVYDIGRFGDRPFFTMKLVKGKTLAALLSERGDPSADRPRFLAIALQVAQAMAYAHAKGVIHRDLKPANVMVGAFGEVQVMDWGLAKVLHEGGIADEERASRQQLEEGTLIRTARSSGSGSGTDTEAGALLGTPAYMPPEQANGDVALLDRRADVFALGAILCEVLTGKPPYGGRSSEEVRRKAANGDLADTRAQLDGCGADAELIALTQTCLSAEAVDRPKDAQAVANALAAYLDGVQVRLHLAELAEAEARARAAEEAKRRRLTVALAATVLLAVTLGGGGWLWLKADHDARVAQVTRDVNTALNRATVLREQAKAAPPGSAALFAQAREQAQRAQALAEGALAEPTLLAQVRMLQADLDKEQKDRTLLAALEAARLAQAETLAGESRFATERAVPLFREALRAYGLTVGQGEPAAAAARLRQRPAAVRQAIVAALDEWIDLADNPRNRISEPHRVWLGAVAEATEPAEGWTRELRAARAEKDLVRRRAALETLAETADVPGLPARALMAAVWPLLEVGPTASAVRLLRRAQRQNPADFLVNEQLGLALMKARPPELAEAVRYLTAGVALRPDSAGAHLNLGRALKDRGQVDEAIGCFRKAIDLDPKYATAHDNLGMALKDKGQLEEASACWRKVIELNPKDARAHYNLGNALVLTGQLEEGISCYRKAIELHPKYVAAHTELGAALRDKGQLEEAIACCRKAIELGPKFAAAHHNLGLALFRKGQLEEAISCHRKGIELDPKNARAHTNLGIALATRGRLDEAIACFKKAIELDRKLARAHTSLGLALHRQGRLDEAIACYRQAIDLDPKFPVPHRNLGSALVGQGRLDEAITCLRQAIKLDPKLAPVHTELGLALFGKGRYGEAKNASARALELLPNNHPSRAGASRLVQTCERFLKLETRLPRLLRGEDKAGSAREALDLVTLCRHQHRHAAAARFFADAFATNPKLAGDRNAGQRYHAACSAALAGAGQGKDAGKLDARERARLREQALAWLRADLATWSTQLEDGPSAARAAVQRKMRHWQQDSALASIRERDALARLTAEERAAFVKLWTDVAALLKKAESSTARETKP
jgi:serine/threonine-protein kinase